jgi:hypothetical protein
LIVTQRTANVTKSILNQCNTVFAMQVFDATGMDFLANYIGATYARTLSNLQKQQSVVFGRAFENVTPLLVDIPRTDRFMRDFWTARGGDVARTAVSEPYAKSAGGSSAETSPQATASGGEASPTTVRTATSTAAAQGEPNID